MTNANPYFHNDMEELDPKSINELHQSILFLLDTSGSMYGERIKMLQKSVNSLRDYMCVNPKVGDIIDVCIMGFAGEPYMIQNFRPVSEMTPVEMKADGGTNLTAALEAGILNIKKRVETYYHNGVEQRIPWIVLITDGDGGKVDEIAEKIHQRTKDHKLKLWMLGVPGYNKETAAKLTKGKRLLELKPDADIDFDDFFGFISQTAVRVSESAPHEEIVPDDPTQGNSTLAIPDLKDWLVD